MLGSMSTLSFSLRATCNLFSSISGDVAASTSGTLCRSAVCEAKLQSDRAAVREARTHCKYGRRDWDYVLSIDKLLEILRYIAATLPLLVHQP